MRKAVSWVGGLTCGLVLVVSCGTSVHDVADMLGLDAGVGDSLVGDAKAAPPITCTPGEAMCEGNKVWSCTYSGNDATMIDDCGGPDFAPGGSRGSTTSNPIACGTVGCRNGAKACCVRAKPQVKWDFTAPFPISGQTFDGSLSPGLGLTLSQSCGGGITLFVTTTDNLCPIQLESGFTLGITAATPFTVGQQLTLPNPNVSLAYSRVQSGTNTTCNAWTGTVTLVGLNPSLKVAINAQCSEADKAAITIVGTAESNR